MISRSIGRACPPFTGLPALSTGMTLKPAYTSTRFPASISPISPWAASSGTETTAPGR